MDRNDLYRSFREIDDDILERSENASKRKRSNIWYQLGNMAACLCLVLATFFPVFHSNGWAVNTPAKLYLEGAVLQTGDGTLTYHTDNFEHHILAFTMELRNELSGCYVVFSADNILREWTDSEGVVHTENELFQVITPCASFEPNPSYTVIDDLLSITVNGKEAVEMPTAPGAYEIVIDYGKLYDRFDIVVERAVVIPFGELVINGKSSERSVTP